MATNDKRLLSAFEEKMIRIAESTATGINPFETKEEKEARVKRLLKNYEAYCAYYFPSYCSAKMADFHRRESRYADRHWNEVILWQWSREFAKSTHANLLRPLFMYFNGQLDGMMTGSANEDLAANLLSDIKANFEGNHRILNDFGDRRSFGNWTDTEFVTNDGVMFKAFGVKQSPRGTRFRHKRPNYGVVDDLQDKESLKNDKISQEHFEWVKEDFMGALSTKKWQLIVPQNRFHKNTVTAKFEADREIKKHVSRVDMLNAQGESNWPENFTTDQCKAKMASVGTISASREYMNTPIEEGKVFKREQVVFKTRLPYDRYDFLVAYSDPSFKATEKSDYKATVLVGKKGLRRSVLKVFIGRVSAKQMFMWHYTMDDTVGDHTMIDHMMEANFIQDMHLNLLVPLAEEKGRLLRLTGDHRSKPHKHQRIESMQPIFENELIDFNITEKDNPGMIELINQLCAFEKGQSINDDGPDALEGALFILDTKIPEGHEPKYIPKAKSKYEY